MTGYFYLLFGLVLLRQFALKGRAMRTGEIRRFYLPLASSLLFLMALDAILYPLLWKPLAREDLRILSLIIPAFFFARQRFNLFFLSLTAFALWFVSREGSLSLALRFLGGAGLGLGMGALERLFEGLKKHLRFSHIPEVLEGEPLLFWLASLLSLAWWGLGGLAGRFVN